MLQARRRVWRVVGAWAVAVLIGMGAPPGLASQAQEMGGKAVYLTEMGRCEPRAALSPVARAGRWQLIAYETVEPGPKRGTMIGAASFIDAPDLTLALGVQGWHAVYVGYWNPHYAYDGGTTIKVKLSDGPCFRRIQEPEPGIEWNATRIQEALFQVADLTGRKLHFGKLHGPFAQKAYIAYVKLVPLSAQEVAALQADRAARNTRIVQATIDGISYFWSNEYRTREHILELVEPYRHSDIGKVVWAVNYGDATNYPTKVGTYWAEERPVPIPSVPGNNAYIAGEKTAYDSLRALRDQGVIPVAVASQHAHAMGLKFDAMFRLAILGPIPPMRAGDKGFLRTYPQFRQVMREGTPVEKASYAFPEVRSLMVSIIRETAENFDIDGASLGFVRGPEFSAYERPVLDDFRKVYHDDGRKVGLDEARMQFMRCRYLTAFVRDVRQALDEVGKQKGKRLELSAWVFPDLAYNRRRGMDVADWMRLGWLDSVIIFGGPLDPSLIAAAKAHKCRCIYNAVGDVAKQWVAGYNAGVDGFSVWDIDTVQDLPSWWTLLRRAGHRKETEAAAKAAPPRETFRLKTIGGFDVLEGLGAAVYSGG